jgi:hypothetical protein
VHFILVLTYMFSHNECQSLKSSSTSYHGWFHMDIHIEIDILGFHPNELNLSFDDVIGSIMDGYTFHLVITNIFLMMPFYK